MDDTTIQPLLSDFKREIRQLYKNRLADIYLFGSYARGEATEESDIDLLVVLSDETIFPFTEIEVMGDITYQLSLNYDMLVSVVPATQLRFEQLASPLYRNVMREGKRL